MNDDWQPISSAPRDGTMFEARDADFGVYMCRYWTKSQQAEAGYPNEEHGFFSLEDESVEPTHWRAMR